MQFADCVSIIKDIALTIGAFVGIWVALNGLATWKKELKGKSQYQLAKEVLFSVYEVREAFIYVRNPFRGEYEYSEDPENPTIWDWHLTEENKYKRDLNLYQNRWKKMENTFSKLENKNLEALVEWGSEHQAIINPLRTCRNLLLIAIFDMLGQTKYKDAWETTKRQIQDDEKSILHMYDDPDLDKFTPEINAAIALFENWLRPHLLHK